MVMPLVEPGPTLSATQIERYSRHLLLPGLGGLGQRRLRQARVCVVGAGGLGSPVLLYLAAAGVGRLGIVDFDAVDVTNLQRQVLHGYADVGRPKVDSARDRVLAIDPDVDVVVHPVRLTAETAGDVLAGYDVVVDGTDNFPTRYVVNDACVRLGLPEVWGSVLRYDAQVSVFWGRPPAASGVAPVQLRDLFPTPPEAGSVPSCAEAGVLGALCGQVGSIMATEVVKLLTGIGTPLLGRVLILDALAARWSELPLRSAGPQPPHRADDVVAPAVDAATAARSDADAEPADAEPADAEPADAEPAAMATVTARELANLLAHRDASPGTDGAPADATAFALIDVREPEELEIVSIPGARSVPLGGILDGSALADLPRDRPLVLACRSGARSARAVVALQAAGFRDVVHLAGGVLAWIEEVDPALPRY